MQFVHCIVWAKDLLFAKLVGDKNQENDLNVRSTDAASSSEQTEDVFERRRDEDIELYGRRIYDHVFGYNIEKALSNEGTWKNSSRPKPIYSRDVLPEGLAQQNGICAADDPLLVSAMASLGMKNPQDIWSLMENSKIFLESLKLFFMKREKVWLVLSLYLDEALAHLIYFSHVNTQVKSFIYFYSSLWVSRRLET